MNLNASIAKQCFNTQPRGGGCLKDFISPKKQDIVSTHSRAEAAARHQSSKTIGTFRFNTQPRGGGCQIHQLQVTNVQLFQHTAARRRLL